MRTAVIRLGNIPVEVVQKAIKNVHLSVHPPTGRVRIAAPERMKLDTIRVYAISKLDWIKRQQRKLREQERETPRELIDRESHFVWGKRFLLTVIEADGPASIKQRHDRLILRLRTATPTAKRQVIIEDWYREQLRERAAPLIARWERKIGVSLTRFFVRRMKTRWGSCNPNAQTIRLNTDLARKPISCLEYIVVHELIHLLEPTHNEVFQAYMNRFMPDWKHRREVLNRLPVRHEDWTY